MFKLAIQSNPIFQRNNAAGRGVGKVPWLMGINFLGKRENFIPTPIRARDEIALKCAPCKLWFPPQYFKRTFMLSPSSDVTAGQWHPAIPQRGPATPVFILFCCKWDSLDNMDLICTTAVEESLPLRKLPSMNKLDILSLGSWQLKLPVAPVPGARKGPILPRDHLSQKEISDLYFKKGLAIQQHKYLSCWRRLSTTGFIVPQQDSFAAGQKLCSSLPFQRTWLFGQGTSPSILWSVLALRRRQHREGKALLVLPGDCWQPVETGHDHMPSSSWWPAWDQQRCTRVLCTYRAHRARQLPRNSPVSPSCLETKLQPLWLLTQLPQTGVLQIKFTAMLNCSCLDGSHKAARDRDDTHLANKGKIQHRTYCLRFYLSSSPARDPSHQAPPAPTLALSLQHCSLYPQRPSCQPKWVTGQAVSLVRLLASLAPGGQQLPRQDHGFSFRKGGRRHLS